MIGISGGRIHNAISRQGCVEVWTKVPIASANVAHWWMVDMALMRFGLSLLYQSEIQPHAIFSHTQDVRVSWILTGNILRGALQLVSLRWLICSLNQIAILLIQGHVHPLTLYFIISELDI